MLERYGSDLREAIKRVHGFEKIVCPKCKVKNPPQKKSCRKCDYPFDKGSGRIRTKNREVETVGRGR